MCGSSWPHRWRCWSIRKWFIHAVRIEWMRIVQTAHTPCVCALRWQHCINWHVRKILPSIQAIKTKTQNEKKRRVKTSWFEAFIATEQILYKYSHWNDSFCWQIIFKVQIGWSACANSIKNTYSTQFSFILTKILSNFFTMADTNTEQVRIFTVKQIIDFLLAITWLTFSHAIFSRFPFSLAIRCTRCSIDNFGVTNAIAPICCVTGYQCYGHRDPNRRNNSINWSTIWKVSVKSFCCSVLYSNGRRNSIRALSSGRFPFCFWFCGGWTCHCWHWYRSLDWLSFWLITDSRSSRRWFSSQKIGLACRRRHTKRCARSYRQ